MDKHASGGRHGDQFVFHQHSPGANQLRLHSGLARLLDPNSKKSKQEPAKANEEAAA